jgi:peptide/nickel transport system permease protein
MSGLAYIARSPIAAVGGAIILFWIVLALAAPWLAPFPPNATLLPFALPGSAAPGGGRFWLGTDHLGRDVLSRLLFGARTVLVFAPLATLAAYAVGVSAGLAAGYKRGWYDAALSRLGDLVLAFPLLVLYIVIIARFGASSFNVVLAITLGSAPGIMRIARGLTLELRGQAYVQAAQMRGEPTWWILLFEILPNARGPLIVDFCLRLGYVVIALGTLGFLGLGLPPPDPDWGGMISQSRQFALVFPHMVIAPCIAVSTLVLGLNLLADGLRELSREG